MITRILPTLGIAFFLTMMACRPEASPLSVELPSTPILTADSQWGVVNHPYLKVLETSEAGSSVKGLLRRGDIVEILSKIGTEDGRSYWLELRSHETSVTGWVPDESLDIYDSKAQARTASVVTREN